MPGTRPKPPPELPLLPLIAAANMAIPAPAASHCSDVNPPCALAVATLPPAGPGVVGGARFCASAADIANAHQAVAEMSFMYFTETSQRVTSMDTPPRLDRRSVHGALHPLKCLHRILWLPSEDFAFSARVFPESTMKPTGKR